VNRIKRSDFTAHIREDTGIQRIYQAAKEIMEACCDDSMIPEKSATMQSGKKTG